MSRVHDALRRAEMGGLLPPEESPVLPAEPPPPGVAPEIHVARDGGLNGSAAAATAATMMANSATRLNLHPSMLSEVQVVAFSPAPESHLLDLNNSHETPAEEFRTLRTRLNHLQTLQPLHTIVVTSPSPAEGKTFSAVNLALAQSHLAEASVLLGDFDLRRPIVHNLFQIDRAPGLSDFLTGQCSFAQALRKVESMNLYLLPAGSPVKNPLELLNMRQSRLLFEELPRIF
ncbi:MAG TPA: CpsD/CapB family tyrosine-protein kinase, partial [Candidatus Acidoferrum sp.]|nr:CpsD/CapB family tyrosine-protein kinase [Candidatus Acidoferrum sp.]